MATLLQRTLRRELHIRGHAYIVAVSPLALKLTVKGKRKGLELHWEALVSGDAALVAALNASVGRFRAEPDRSEPVAANARPASPRARQAAALRTRKAQ